MGDGSMTPEELAARLADRFADPVVARGETTVVIAADDLLASMQYLSEEPDLTLTFLSDLTATDWPNLSPRFWVAYHLLSMEHRHRLRVKVGLDGDVPHVPSLTPLFPAANWLEREAFDFFGIVFDGHPDLRRIEMPEDWVGHPLRKDEPLAGVKTAYKGGAFIPPPDERGV